METMIHPLADVQCRNIGHGTRIWQYVVILERAHIGNNCNVCSHVLIENDVLIGNEVTIKSGVQIWDGVTIDDRVFIGPNVTFINDRTPRSKHYAKPIGRTWIGKGASIGGNATLMCGIKVGDHAMIGAGAVVTKDVGRHELWYGNPAFRRGYVSADGDPIGLDFRSKQSGRKYSFTDGGLVPDDRVS